MNPRNPVGLSDLEANFPRSGKFRNGPWVGQTEILRFVAEHGSSLIESPTGSGKTPVQYTILEAVAQKRPPGPLFWIAPNKVIVRQHHDEFPHLKVMYGQNEHPCPWAAEEFKQQPSKWVGLHELPVLAEDPRIPRVSDIPQVLHKRCPHYVNQETGETQEPGVIGCPYYQQKYESRQGGIVLATMSYYIFYRLFVDKEPVATVVIDEAHRMAEVVRYSLSYDITDWHLTHAITLLDRVADVQEEKKALKKFLRALKAIPRARGRKPREESLLEEEEIRRLLAILEAIDGHDLLEKINTAVAFGLIDPVEERVVLKKLETLVRDLSRYIHSFEYSLPKRDEEGEVKHGPLNYACAMYVPELEEGKRVQSKLVIRCHSVAPLVKKRLLAPFTVSFSATVGDPEVFGWETGITHPLLALTSNFPVGNTRVYLPSDARDLSKNNRSRADVAQTLRKIARTCVQFALQGQRSLVVVISNHERERFLKVAEEEGLAAVSYGNGVSAKTAVAAFQGGEGDTLVGTAAQFGEGVDLPKQTAPVTFFLRPGYPNPKSASTQFEEEKYGSRCWKIWNWRVSQQALQVRGRNVRNRADLGVTFFMSRQFKRFLYGCLPEWLKPAYRGALTFEAAVADAKELLG
jgi:Rad3-related DNA helicase